jgi:hypothetical protein
VTWTIYRFATLQNLYLHSATTKQRLTSDIMPLSTTHTSGLTAQDNTDIERQVAADTAGLSLTEVEKMETTAYTQYTAASEHEGANSGAATAALFRWALVGRHLDSMQSKSQHVSSIPFFAGCHRGQADGINRTAMGSAVSVMLLGIEY